VSKPLTELERRVLDYLIEYLRANTYQPSVREIGTRFTIKSTKTVSELLQSLADKGWIERDPSRSRGVRLLGMDMGADTVAVPLLDGASGSAPPAMLQFDRRLVGRHGTFFVAMDGDHLVEDGIRRGDLLLVEPFDVADAVTGDILWVRTATGGAARRAVRDGVGLRLEAVAGEQVGTPLTPRQAAAVVEGRVVGIVRRLRPVADHAPYTVAPAV
jgi:repressor LexA